MHPYRPLGAFRFLLAFLVMLQHFAAHAARPWLRDLLQPYEPGSVAVLAFFALSGFVIAQAVEDHYRDRPEAFLENRMLRILPHFLMAMTLAMGLSWLLGNAPFSVRNIVLNFLSILPGTERLISSTFIPIVWAIRVEVAFYLVIVGSIWLGKKARMPWQRVALIALLPLLGLYALALQGLAPALFGFVPYFTYGVALYFALQGSKRACLLAGAALMGMELHFLCQSVVHPQVGFAREVGPQNLLLLLLIAAMTMLARLHTEKYMAVDIKIGALTYPLYLYHYLVLIVMMQGVWVSFAGGMATSILLAAVMTWIVEPPLARLRAHIRANSAS